MHAMVTGISSLPRRARYWQSLIHRWKIQIFTSALGLVCAQDIFHRKVDETFGDLQCVTGITDDIVVYGYKSDFSDHDENLCVVLQRARETGLRFNLDKCRFRCTQIPFFGHYHRCERSPAWSTKDRLHTVYGSLDKPCQSKHSLGWSSS